MSRVLVAMSGGVDSSVAAALLLEQGHEVEGVTLRLWGGTSDSGCCSVSDVDDARRVAQQLGIAHWVFNFADDFDRHVVEPYVAAHAAGVTPNPCIECNRHVKFDRLVRRAAQLGFDFVATGHHVRRVEVAPGVWALARAVDAAKDQSYVVHMLGPEVVARCLFPIGELEKADVRRRAAALGLRTATKPDSQDVCFVARAAGGRAAFLGERMALHPGQVVDTAGRVLGEVPAVELVTVGQRKKLGIAAGEPRFVLSVDTAARRVVVGSEDELLSGTIALHDVVVTGPVDGPLLAQCSAHGRAEPCTFDAATATVERGEPQRRVAPGQTVVLYRGDVVVAGGIAA